MHECSMFAEITGNYKLFGTPDSQRSHCAIVVTICGMQDEQHGQCTYSITLRDIHLVIVAVEKQLVLKILSLCSLSYPAHNVHAPYNIVICGLSGFTIYFYIIS